MEDDRVSTPTGYPHHQGLLLLRLQMLFVRQLVLPPPSRLRNRLSLRFVRYVPPNQVPGLQLRDQATGEYVGEGHFAGSILCFANQALEPSARLSFY